MDVSRQGVNLSESLFFLPCNPRGCLVLKSIPMAVLFYLLKIQWQPARVAHAFNPGTWGGRGGGGGGAEAGRSL